MSSISQQIFPKFTILRIYVIKQVDIKKKTYNTSISVYIWKYLYRNLQHYNGLYNNRTNGTV
jgi:hypothetical protein